MEGRDKPYNYENKLNQGYSFNDKKRKKNHKKGENEKFVNGGSIGNMSNFNKNGAGLNYGNNHGNYNTQNRTQNYELYNKRPGFNYKGLQGRADINNYNHNQSNYIVSQQKTFPGKAKFEIKESTNLPTYQKISFNSLANVFEKKTEAENKKMKISEKVRV